MLQEQDELFSSDEARGPSEGSDDDDEDEEAISEGELEQLRAAVASNPFDYEAHVRLVAALRTMEGKGEALRDAREQMAKTFPLPEEEWLQWIEDEGRRAALAGGPSFEVLSLFERALQDYRSTLLWERYCRFMESFSDAESVRGVYEEALTAVGLHVAAGARIWQAFREFEVKQGEPDRIRKLYHRQLSVPLLGMGEVYSKYLTWESNEEAALQLKRGYEAAVQQLLGKDRKLIRIYGREGLRWLEYIELLLPRTRNPPTVAVERCRSLFKRACNCVSVAAEQLLEEWMSFEREFGNLQEWSEADHKCQRRLQELQRQYQAEAQRAAAEDTMKMPPPDSRKQQRRQRRDTERTKGKERAEKQARGKQKTSEKESTQRKRKVETETPANASQDDAKKRRVDAADSVPDEEAQYAEHSSASSPSTISTEVTTDGTPAPARTVWVGSLPWAVTEESLKEAFEQFGPVKDVRLVRDKIGKLKGFGFVEFAAQPSVASALEGKAELAGRSLIVQQMADAKSSSRPQKQSEESPTEPVESAPEESAKPDQARTNKPQRTYNDALTIFVSNLAFDTTEGDLRRLFGDCGTMKAIRIIKDRKQKSKGFAYIEWADEESRAKALARNQTILCGRPINVAPSKPPRAAAQAAPVVRSTKPATSFVPRMVQRTRLQLKPAPITQDLKPCSD